ncbi:MAG: DUF6602 domain-containing protein [Bryobacteraceae bacterium]
MPRPPDSGQIDLHDIFLRVQSQMLAELSVGRLFEHPSAAGAATEHHWLSLFAHYLPKRYKAAPAFIINSAGRRSRQIDIAIFDTFHSSPLFPHISGDHIPVESVYAVFEVKPTISKQWLQDASEKAASVRELSSSKRKILAGLLATSSVWQPDKFGTNLRRALATFPPPHRIDFGCALEHGAFQHHRSISIAGANRALIFFLLRLITRLDSLGPTPKINLLDYLSKARTAKSRAR